MPWVIIDDAFMGNEKWEHAPCDSIAMWVAALAWCNANERWDGRIPTRTLSGLVPAKNPKRTVLDLEQRRAVHRDGDDHVIHDFAEWQRVDKKKAISEARKAAGKRGAAARWGDGKDGGNGDGNSHGKSNALPPTTTNRVLVSDNSTPENTPPGVDNSDHRLDLIAADYGAHALKVAKLKGAAINDDDAYVRKAARRVRGDSELGRLATMFPTAPVNVIAAALHGEKHSLGVYPRADEIEAGLATVHHLRGTA